MEEIAEFQRLLSQVLLLGGDQSQLGAYLMDRQLAEQYPYKDGDMRVIVTAD